MAIYMQFPGAEGDVTAKGHEKWINLEGYEFKVSRKINTLTGTGGNREGSTPHVSELLLTKRMDKTTSKFFEHAVKASAATTVKIDLCTTSANLDPYMEYVLTDVKVSRYEVDHESANVQAEEAKQHKYPLETISLNFSKIQMSFKPFDDQNKTQSAHRVTYDIGGANATS